MNWGKWIVVSFVFFALFIAVLVTVCINQDISLVSKSYYQDELLYNKQLTKIQDTQQLAVQPVIEIEVNKCSIDFSTQSTIRNATLRIVRPSDASLDQIHLLQSQPKQSVFLKNLQPGMYKVQLEWSMDNKDYYLEKQIYI